MPNELDLSQRSMRPKIQRFLESRRWPPALIERCQQGFCNGLVIMYLMSELEIAEHHKLINSTESTLEKLAAWDGDIACLSHDDQLEIAFLIIRCEFLQHISFYQNVNQGDLHDFFYDRNNRRPHAEFMFAGLLKLRDFFQQIPYQQQTVSLFDELFRYPHRIILVSCGGHTLGLFNHGKHVAYYNANHKHGNRYFSLSQREKLVDAMYSSYKFDPRLPAPFGFKIFTFNEPQAYVEPLILLAGLQPPLECTQQRADNKTYSALYIAARIGSLACVNFYLAQGGNIHTKTGKKTPYEMAARKGHVDIVKTMFLKHGFTPQELIKALRKFSSDARRSQLINALAIEQSSNTALSNNNSLYVGKHARFFPWTHRPSKSLAPAIVPTP